LALYTTRSVNDRLGFSPQHSSTSTGRRTPLAGGTPAAAMSRPAGAKPPLGGRQALPSLAKVPVRQEDGGDHRPGVEQVADPLRRDLHPEADVAPVELELVVGGLRPVPPGEHHCEVAAGESKHEVEQPRRECELLVGLPVLLAAGELRRDVKGEGVSLRPRAEGGPRGRAQREDEPAHLPRGEGAHPRQGGKEGGEGASTVK